MTVSRPSPPARAAWKLQGNRADLLAGTAPVDGARLDLARPGAGLATGRGDHLLGLDTRADRTPIDSWVRGDDVTATWDSGDERALRATALWRVRPAGDQIAAWELIASATTAKLHADSTLAVVSDMAADAILSSMWHDGRPGPFVPGAAATGHGLVLVRRGDGTSGLVMLHPLEHQSVAVEHGGGRARIACRLFASGVEKGVLLRSRVLAAVGPAEGDLAWAGRLAAEFAASPPELAT